MSKYQLRFIMNLMESYDYKDRFVGDFLYVQYRKEHLIKIIDDYKNNKLSFKLNCPVDLLKEQLDAMTQEHILIG